MTPQYLKHSDQIRIISPSGSIHPEHIDGAKKVLFDWGLNVTEGEFARSEYGRFAGTKEQRIADLQQALDDPNVKAILCSRGGYGIAQIIDKIDFTAFAKSPKWLVGFSDITILHNLITNLGIASIHAIMAKHLTELPADCEPVLRLKDILFGKFPDYKIPDHPMNRKGKTVGKLIGGNLSVDRMIQNLRFSGMLAQLSGLVVGQFTDCEEDPLMMQTVLEIISDALRGNDYPVCFNFPAGHVDYNLPLLLGTNVTLEVNETEAKLIF